MTRTETADRYQQEAARQWQHVEESEARHDCPHGSLKCADCQKWIAEFRRRLERRGIERPRS